MSALLDRMKQLQREERALNDAIADAWRFLPYQPDPACDQFLDAEHQIPTLRREWEQWLDGYEAVDSAQSDAFRAQTDERLRQSASFLAQGYGTALSLLGRLQEARQAYERSAAALGEDAHPFRASLMEDLGRLALQQGAFDEADAYYRRAHELYLQFASPEAWDEIVGPEDAPAAADRSREAAVRILGTRAQGALQRGDREAFLEHQLEAIDGARTNGFADLAQSLWLHLYTWKLHWDVRGALPEALKEQLDALDDVPDGLDRAGLTVDRRVLEAENAMARNSPAEARKRLRQAGELLDDHPELLDKWWKLHLAYAAFSESQGRIDDALDHAEQALDVARDMGGPDLIQQALFTVVSLAEGGTAEHRGRARDRLDETIEALREVEAREALAFALLQRAELHLSAEEYELALADLNEAADHALTRDLRRQVLAARAAALKMDGQTAEALSTLETAIQLSREQMLPEGQPSAERYRDLLHQTETLHEGAALLAADLGRVHEAFDWAETGKTLLLRQQRAQAGRTPPDEDLLPQVRYDDALRQSLRDESVAFLFFCVGTGRTLALLLDPQEADPQPFFVDLTESDLQDTTTAGLWPVSETNRDQFREVLSSLSEKLLAPIEDVLRDVMDRCDILYVVPDSRLSLVPFSALPLNGAPLVEHDRCALALAPSVGFWQSSREQRPVDRERSALVVGAGRSGDFSFADQARAIMAEQPWSHAPTYLLDDDGPVTGDRVWDAAREHTVVHFSCHGMEDPTALDTLSALYLELSDHEKWSAKDIFDREDDLSAELVFLNACMSGRFRLREGLAIGGFWEAFLHAGASALIATLATVHPEDAETLARSFYQRWLQGDVTKARALQLAQQDVRRAKPDSLQWARYVLVGDHR